MIHILAKLGLIAVVISGMFAANAGLSGDTNWHAIGGTVGLFIALIASFFLFSMVFRFLGCLFTFALPIGIILLVLYSVGALDKVITKVSDSDIWGETEKVASKIGSKAEKMKEDAFNKDTSLSVKDKDSLPLPINNGSVQSTKDSTLSNSSASLATGEAFLSQEVVSSSPVPVEPQPIPRQTQLQILEAVEKQQAQLQAEIEEIKRQKELQQQQYQQQSQPYAQPQNQPYQPFSQGY